MRFTFKVMSKGDSDIIDITDKISELLRESNKESGLVNIFAKHTTAAVTIAEHEQGAIQDLKEALERVFPEDHPYNHNRIRNDDNGHSHVRSSLIKQDMTIPFEDNSLLLGIYQRIFLLDSSPNSREREVILTIIENK